MKREYHNPTVLSDRQHQVAQLLSEDYTQEQIAEKLDISQIFEANPNTLSPQF